MAKNELVAAKVEELARTLAEHGFDGTVSIECEDPLIDAETSVRRSADVLAGALRHVGGASG